MIAIVNKNKVNNKFLPLISIVKHRNTLKKKCKKQLTKEIIENPNSLKAYKEIEVYKIAEVNEDIDLTNCKKELLFTYEEILNEIIEQLTKGEENEHKSK